MAKKPKAETDGLSKADAKKVAQAESRLIKVNTDGETFHPSLPFDIALRSGTEDEIRRAYNLSEEDWNKLAVDTKLLEKVKEAKEFVQKDGGAFKAKARLEAEKLLETAFAMIHDRNVPAAAKVELIKFVVKCAGLVDDNKAAAVGTALQINIQM